MQKTEFRRETRLLGAGRSSAGQQLLLGLGELLVAQHAGVVQLRQLLQLRRQVRPRQPLAAALRVRAPVAAQAAEPGRQPHPADRLDPEPAALPPLALRTSALDDGGQRPPSRQRRRWWPRHASMDFFVSSYDPPDGLDWLRQRLRMRALPSNCVHAYATASAAISSTASSTTSCGMRSNITAGRWRPAWPAWSSSPTGSRSA